MKLYIVYAIGGGAESGAAPVGVYGSEEQARQNAETFTIRTGIDATWDEYTLNADI